MMPWRQLEANIIAAECTGDAAASVFALGRYNTQAA
jgi:hypothetical protein